MSKLKAKVDWDYSFQTFAGKQNLVRSTFTDPEYVHTNTYMHTNLTE